MTSSVVLRERMAGELSDVADPPWVRAVAEVPREVFVGDRYYEEVIGPQGVAVWRPVVRAGKDDSAWLEAVYTDQTLVTQISGVHQTAGETEPVLGWPTSSSTLPSLVIAMLADLQVTDGMSVLEIGTGTGYSAGLLCHRLGAENITSIEIDSKVAGHAAVALGQAGYRPRLLIGDGLVGYAPGAPYDRIISTCSVRRIPRPWLTQATEGGIIVTAMSGWLMGSALVRLTVTGPETATGTFLPGTVSFMTARAHAAPAGGLRLPQRPEAIPTDIGADVLGDWTQRWIAQLAAPKAIWSRLASTTDAADTETVLYDPSGSCARLRQASDGTWTVAQTGPEHLWDHVQTAVTAWRAAGSPPQHEFQLTVGRNRQIISHADIDQVWDLPVIPDCA